MGEVYKAADSRLNRTVAIKVLPPHFSDDPERRHRFEREAQAIAALNHPHICTLHDVGKQGDIDFLVMEYLEGETLAERIRRGPLSLDEALKVGIAVADALEKAHGQGVTHRDLKPANIMLTAGGAAKLLDFGLAKLEQQPQASRSPSTPPPTPAAALLNTTTPGMVLGTMQYMSPEQLEGSEADARTDIFAFGAVLYEAITGKKAFEGKSQPHLIAAILSVDPEPVSKSQPAAPPALDFLIRRCLAKDPEQRLQSATDLVWELQWVAEGGSQAGAHVPFAVSRRRRTKQAQLALAIATVVVAALGMPALWASRAAAPRDVTRFLIPVPDMPIQEAVSISPDGRTIAYSARETSSTSVFVRPIGTEAAQKLAGTDGAGRLFWSPDSRWIAFFAGGKLKKIEAAGGPPQNICETPDLLGGSWNADGVILFASSKGLHRVLAAGGEPSQIAVANESRQEPYFLPDGRHYLYLGGGEKAAGAAIFAGSLDSKDSTRLVSTQSNAAYVEPGYLLYHREGTLYAQPFNPKSLALSGDAIRVADRIPFGAGPAAFAASNRNVLLYRNTPQPASAQSGTAAGGVSSAPLLWFGRSGNKLQEAGEAGGWAGVDLSPDGRHAAVHRHDGDGGDVWIFEAGNSTPSKFTFDASQDNSMPIWSPDGKRIAFGSRRNGKWGLYVKVADNTRTEELVLEAERAAMPMSWSGDRLVYWTYDPKTSGDIWSVSLAGEKKPVPVLQTLADERNPQVSADGKWIAYSSNETGRSEIYIRPFPEGPGKIQVSVNGGVYPRWRRDGKELYFLSLVSVGALMASDISVSGSSVRREVPHLLFQSVFLSASHPAGQYHAYAVSADGKQFLIPQFENVASAFGGRGRGGTTAAIGAALASVIADRHGVIGAASSSAPIVVVLDWTAALKK